MSKLPRDVHPKKLIALLKKYGFAQKSQNGSHVKLCHEEENHIVIVPVHAKGLPVGTLQNILKQAKLDREVLDEI